MQVTGTTNGSLELAFLSSHGELLSVTDSGKGMRVDECF